LTSGLPITIEATASDANGTVTKVEFFNGTTKLGEDLTSPYNFVWNDVSDGKYSITAKATNNLNKIGTSQPVAISVGITASPIADAGEDVFLTLPENSVELSALGNSVDGPPLEFNWIQVSGPSTLTIFNPTLQDIALTNLIEGTYIVELTVTDIDAHASKDQVRITVSSPSGIPEGIVPRFFSPNDDGVNDFWEWPTTEVLSNSVLSVYNQFGQKIYEKTSYDNTWDGKLDGKPLQDDAYYYIIQLANGKDVKGAVRIMR